jgi:parvulin-like peptidyl-prolyl isomerase
MMLNQFAKPERPYITDEQKAEWLKKHASLFRVGDKLKLWSITIPGQARGKTPTQQSALAKEVRESLVNGADFASQARTHSVDSKRDAGGSWDWIEKKDLADQFWPIVSKLPTGKISDIVPFQGSYYIFWVEARQPGKMKPQAEVEAHVERGVKAEQRQKASDEWLKKLRRKATIRYPK